MLFKLYLHIRRIFVHKFCIVLQAIFFIYLRGLENIFIFGFRNNSYLYNTIIIICNSFVIKRKRKIGFVYLFMKK